MTHETRSDALTGALARVVRALLAPQLQVRHFRKGTLLWREGETSGMLVAITSGRVKAYRLLATGRAVTLYLFGPGDVFGFIPFIDGGPYPAYAQAIEDVTADVMPRSVLLRLLREDPALAPKLISLLGQRLREAFDMIESLSGSSSVGRVAAALLHLLPEAPPRSSLRRDRQ
jgi:CRP/FNR family transcriptional regulator